MAGDSTLAYVATPGYYYDSNLGLYYVRQRWYDPESKQWLTQDPIGYAAGTANLYQYTYNSPLVAIDPSGLKECKWTKEVGIRFYDQAIASVTVDSSVKQFSTVSENWNLIHELTFKVDDNGITGVSLGTMDGMNTMKGLATTFFVNYSSSVGNPIQKFQPDRQYDQTDNRWTTISNFLTSWSPVSCGKGPMGIRVRIMGTIIAQVDAGKTVFVPSTVDINKFSFDFRGFKTEIDPGDGTYNIGAGGFGVGWKWTAPNDFKENKKQYAEYWKTYDLCPCPNCYMVTEITDKDNWRSLTFPMTGSLFDFQNQ